MVTFADLIKFNEFMKNHVILYKNIIARIGFQQSTPFDDDALSELWFTFGEISEADLIEYYINDIINGYGHFVIYHKYEIINTHYKTSVEQSTLKELLWDLKFIEIKTIDSVFD
jgi:hypothetical protein